MSLLIIWCLFGVVSAFVLSSHNKAGQGCLLGTLLGPIGLIIALVERSSLNRQTDIVKMLARRSFEPSVRRPEPIAETRNERKCPFCAEKILVEAKVCKHCKRDVPGVHG